MKVFNVVLIDHHPEGASRIRNLLDQNPLIQHHVTHVFNFNEAMTVLEKERCDLILLNLDGTPGCSDLEDLREISLEYPRFPIIVLINGADQEFCLDAIKNGAQDYLIKERMDEDALYTAIMFAAERKKRELELLYLANHDPLTGLPNRRLFSDRLERGMKRFYRKTDHLNLGIILLDLDEFKQVNDRYGHQVGDKVLSVVGSRLNSRLRKNDTIARLGGDEFVIILEGVSKEAIGVSVAKELLNIVSQPIMIDHHQIFVTASIGIAYYPTHGKDVEELLGKADQAMYRAKNLKAKIFVYEG